MESVFLKGQNRNVNPRNISRQKNRCEINNKNNPSEMAAVQENRRISSRGSKKSIAPITATSRLRNDYVRYILFLNLNKGSFFSESNDAFQGH